MIITGISYRRLTLHVREQNVQNLTDKDLRIQVRLGAVI